MLRGGGGGGGGGRGREYVISMLLFFGDINGLIWGYGLSVMFCLCNMS